MSEAMPAKPGRSGLWVKIVLAVSLALNLMVAGVIVGSRLSDGPSRDPRGPDERAKYDPALGPFGRVLPEDLRRAASDAVRQRAGDRRDIQEELAASVDAALALLRQSPFDAEALSEVLEAQSEIFGRRAATGREVIVEKVALMSDSQRIEMADRLEKGFARALDENRPPPPPKPPGKPPKNGPQ